jgi:hypothetical protein
MLSEVCRSVVVLLEIGTWSRASIQSCCIAHTWCDARRHFYQAINYVYCVLVCLIKAFVLWGQWSTHPVILICSSYLFETWYRPITCMYVIRDICSNAEQQVRVVVPRFNLLRFVSCTKYRIPEYVRMFDSGWMISLALFWSAVSL